MSTSKVPYTSVLEVEIGGKLHPDVAPLLVEGWVEASVNIPATFELVFTDPRHEVVKKQNVKIGTKVKITGRADGDSTGVLCTGEVTGLEADFDGTGTHTIIRGLDFAHRLLRGTRVKGYKDMTASDIARKIAKRLPSVGKIDATTTKYDLITQPNVSDWVFLKRLGEENEREVYFTDDGEFQFVKPKDASSAPSPSHTYISTNPRELKQNSDLKRLRVAVTASDQVQKVEVRGWEVDHKRSLSSEITSLKSDEIDNGTSPAKFADLLRKAELHGVDVPFDTDAQVRNAAKSLAEDVTSASAELEAEINGDPKLRPGMPVALSGFGDPFEGKYTASVIRHQFSNATGYHTWVVFSGRQNRSLYGLASGGSGMDTGIPGVVIGLVDDNDDPLQQGRVKLRFPWLSEKYVSDWCRSMQFGGERGGGVISPDVGDEVLVAFDRGALDHPYVIGGLYNGKDDPHRDSVKLVNGTTGRVNRRTLADRDKNRVELYDAPTQKGIRLRTDRDRLVVHLDKLKSKITVKSSGEVEIEGTTNVNINAGALMNLKSGTMSIETGDLNIKATAVQIAAADTNLTGVLSVEGASNLIGNTAVGGNLEVVGDVNILGMGFVDGVPIV